MPEISVQYQCATLTDLVGCESFGAPIGDQGRTLLTIES